MPSGKKTKWLWLALLYVLILEGLSWWPSPAAGPCLIDPQEHAQPDQNNNQQACPTFFKGSLILLGRADHFIERHDKSIVAIFTVVLALSTILLWRSTDKLWQAGERQMELIAANAAQQALDTKESLRIAAISSEAAEESSHNSSESLLFAAHTAEQQLRAYLGVRKVRIENFSVGSNPQIRFFLRNNGATPAYKVAASASVGIADYPHPKGTPFPVSPGALRSIGGTLNPGEQILHNFMKRAPLTQEDINLVQTGKRAMYLVIEVTFRDAFGHNRYVKVRRMYNEHAIVIGTRRLFLCEEGNETSESG